MPRRQRAARGRGEELRSEILAATRRLLMHVGSADDVSMRAISEAVGVTAPSIYRHFADKDELIQAVCAEVFDELDRQLQAAASDRDSPIERVRLQGAAYVRFARQNPEQYRIATMVHSNSPSHLDHALSSAAFVHFNEAVQACIEDGTFPSGPPISITLRLWAAAHGIASLLIAKPFLPWGDPDEFAEQALRNACIGECVSGLFDQSPTADQFRAWLDKQPRSQTTS